VEKNGKRERLPAKESAPLSRDDGGETAPEEEEANVCIRLGSDKKKKKRRRGGAL